MRQEAAGQEALPQGKGSHTLWGSGRAEAVGGCWYPMRGLLCGLCLS